MNGTKNRFKSSIIVTSGHGSKEHSLIFGELRDPASPNHSSGNKRLTSDKPLVKTSPKDRGILQKVEAENKAAAKSSKIDPPQADLLAKLFSFPLHSR